MDIAAMSMQNSLKSIQSSISMTTLKKAMNQDAQGVMTLIQDMKTANPVAFSRSGGLDIRA